ncbi:major capsid subunit [Arthrobacter phage HunterDalle]|uniref:Major capsid protein n=6 Tax=Korravirus hunterdalle TaxID=1982080 RepID=A0A3G8FV23_9CAUD|nr:major capsid subunit [Arthrobacter phage HunterDalle]ALY10670.1 major capsid protein [Arthrobacter phage Vulture]AZF98631.1 major capsid protein [Arthrobacter phage Aledel]AZS07692.1 major capsid protein [Arthrobacter phage Eunoia]AZS09153.1 major capsid protein [Arthrobacter phage OMalley]AZS09637.1 major capsid protein [Arthrobacter phage Riovina]
MDLKAQRAAALKAAQALTAKAAGEGRDLTDAEAQEVEGHIAEVKSLDAKIAAGERGKGLLSTLGSLAKGDENEDLREKGLQTAAKSLGDHFAKSIYSEVKENLGVKGYSVSTSEWEGPAKAAGDTHTVGSVFQTPVLTEFDRTIVQAPRPELILADLLGSGTISGQAIAYFIEQGPVQGGFTTVAEGAAKPQLHIPDPILASDAIRKIAGFIKFTDEMMEDLPFVVSEINTRLLYELAKFEEQQLIYGDGTGQNILGLLNRSGIQLGARTSGEGVADAIFRQITAVQTASGLNADSLVMHPLDYQALRLQKDANEQYMGGGFFQGQYGNGGVLQNPPVWGLRTLVTPSVAQGTAIVGALKQATTVYRKGGVRVESTNSHSTDFTDNKITVRAEERLGLAVRRPSAIVKLDLAPVA